MKLEVLKIPAYRNLWLGQAISQFGDAMYFLVFLYMADKLTRSSEVVSYVGIAAALPYLLLSAWSGVVADRIDRRTIMLCSDLFSFTALAVFGAFLATRQPIPVWTLLAMSASLGIVNVFFAPAKSAAIPQLVPPEQLAEANSLSAATQQFMPLLGIGLSGSLLAAVERTMPGVFFLSAVLLNALTFLGSAWFLRRLPKLKPVKVSAEEKTSRTKEFVEGLQYVRVNPNLRTALWLTFALNLGVAPFMVVYVTVNRQWFGGRYETLASFEAAFAGFMVLTSFYLTQRTVRRIGVSALSGIVSCGVFIAMMAFAPSFWPFLVLNALCGIAVPYLQIPLQTYVQIATEDAYRGRVSSLFQMVGLGLQPITVAMAGRAIHAHGPQTMFLAMGGCMILAASFGFGNRAFRTATIPSKKQEPQAVVA